MQTLRETWLIFRRSLILTLRQPVWLLMGIFQPILYLVLFGPLLEGAVTQAGAGVNAFDWFVPGMLVMVAVFGAAFVGFGLIAELRYGVIERMRVTPDESHRDAPRALAARRGPAAHAGRHHDRASPSRSASRSTRPASP